MSTDFTLDELCVVACAEAWRGDGEILASPMGTIPMLGARLARATFAPDLVLSDGVASLIGGIVPLGGTTREIEGWVPYRTIFDIVWSGRRHVMMGASQIDRFGNQNIACIGDFARPKSQLLGVRGAPGNTINHPTSYWIPNHTSRVFVPKVDFVSGVGYDRAAALGPQASRFHEIGRVVSNKGVFDFETPDHAMRLRSVHPGVSVYDVVANTGFPLIVPADVPQTRAPSADELTLIRDVLDPKGARKLELLSLTMTSPALHTRICDLFGIDVPIIQTGMGWVAGPRLTAATSAAGGLGVLAAATMTLPQLQEAIADVRRRTDKPFGVNFRADQPDAEQRAELIIAEKVRVASFAQAPAKALIKKLKDAGVLTMTTVGARRHAEKVADWGLDALIAQGHEGGGHTGAVPTTLLLPQVVDAVPKIPVLGAGGFFDGRGLVAALAYGAAGIAMGTRFLLTQESRVPDAVKKLYLDTQVTGTVVTRAVDGQPQRVIRTDLIEKLEKSGKVSSWVRALRHAWHFRNLSGVSFWALFRAGREMHASQGLSWSQVAMAANAPMLTRAALVEGRTDVGVLPTGQAVGVIQELPTVAELIARVMAEAEQALERLAPAPAFRKEAANG